MKLPILAGAIVLVLAAGTTTSATASDHRGASGHHSHRLVRAYYGDRDAGPSYGGRYYSLGPLGFTSVPPGSYSGYGTPIDAWSR
ncbi:hypothetical protein [Bradyrhizobium sp.]|jgi:hypothetical protein|uniref:hypothetical protein n=1 Tax=Bradyrhizobium sp. TaxID=376 RepID=UPI003C38D8B6